ncbi:components of type IV pilus [Agrobacterium albertimagni AOL15]|uniref:Components of type IV pilus n=1 Tax=Agrobacterium albertimagni AOL15 TaxID=1156935 RepID=K2QHJ8_9HYPH|nr:pilus assembly protein CpaD [Agrobacterium albertimagni]EKF60596.1 components of type IV pilus [Agrobacterium albertimagni AOL15]
MASVGHSFQHILLAGLVLGTAVALSGCGSTKDRMTTSAVPDDYRTRHPIMLSEVEHTLDVPIASGDRSLTVGVQDSIAGFAADYLSASTGTIQIMVPHGSPNSGAASTMRKQIRHVLITRGVAANRIIETSYQAEANSNAAPVRLSYVAITAMTNPCGEWPEDLQSNTFSNKNYHNFGCATQSNLAAQIANPMDLVTPRDMAPIDATRRSTVIGLYRRGADTSTN